MVAARNQTGADKERLKSVIGRYGILYHKIYALFYIKTIYLQYGGVDGRVFLRDHVLILFSDNLPKMDCVIQTLHESFKFGNPPNQRSQWLSGLGYFTE